MNRIVLISILLDRRPYVGWLVGWLDNCLSENTFLHTYPELVLVELVDGVVGETVAVAVKANPFALVVLYVHDDKHGVPSKEDKYSED